MTDRELFEKVLEAMEHLNRTGDTQVFDLCYAPELIPALRERLAQPEIVMAEYKHQTYAAYKTPDGEMKIGVVPDDAPLMLNGVPLYPRREWVGLTEEERISIRDRVQQYTPIESVKYGFALQVATEQELKEKNT